MDREAARSLLLMHVRSGTPMHPRTRDRAVAAAEWDDEFDRMVAAHARARDWDRERERQDRARIRPMMQAIRDALQE